MHISLCTLAHRKKTRKGQWPCNMLIMVLEIIGHQSDIFKSEPVWRHCKYLMDGCTLRIRGMCARSDGPWKTERPVAQTLLVRLLHLTCANFPYPVAGLFSCFIQILLVNLTYKHTCANFPCPVILLCYADSSCPPPTYIHVPIFSILYFSLVLYRFFLWTSCAHTCVNYFVCFSSTLLLQGKASLRDTFALFRLFLCGMIFKYCKYCI